MFRIYADRLEKITNATCIRQLNGPDQRYWDFEADGTTVALYSDVFDGISLYVENGRSDGFLRRLAAKITEPSVGHAAADSAH